MNRPTDIINAFMMITVLKDDETYWTKEITDYIAYLEDAVEALEYQMMDGM